MGLLTKTVEVKWVQGTRKHYESKGYKWTKLYDTFKVPVKDLPPKSNIKVKVECDCCGEQKEVRYSTYIENHYLKENGKYICNKCFTKFRDILPYEEVKNRVESLKKGYKLLSKTYEGKKKPIKIQCDLGHVYETTISVVNLGSKCPVCHKLYGNRGETNPNYNPHLTDEERIENRDTLKNIKWREKVYERDNYTCQKCGEYGGRLNAHHLNGYHWDKKNRFNINNGVTLCVDCHKEYHLIFGAKNSTKNDYYRWVKDKNATI